MLASQSRTARFFPYQGLVNLADRHRLNQHMSGCLWFSGLSGSGKSTLAHALEARLHKLGVRSYVLDGDNVRQRLNCDLGLSPEDRRENIRRVGEVARLMVDAGLLVFAAFITPYQAGRDYLRGLMRGMPYYECYVRCDLEICEARDPKGLYRRARAGEISDLTGLGAPYEEPLTPDLVVDTGLQDLDACVDRVVDFLIERGLVRPECGACAPA